MLLSELCPTNGAERKLRQTGLETENKSKILIYVQSYPQYEYDDKLKIAGVLKKPENFGTNNFDWPAYLAKDGIHYEMFYPQVEFISGGNGFWLKEKLFALKERFFVGHCQSRAGTSFRFFGRDNNRARESLPESLQEKFRTSRSGAYCGLVRIQHNHCGGNNNAVFQFSAPISGNRRGNYQGNFVCP